MLRRIFLSGYRAALRNRTTFLINLSGLAIGLAVCLLIASYVYDEFHYDMSFPNSNRICRVYFHDVSDTRYPFKGVTQGRLGQALRENVPGVATAATYWPSSHLLVRVNDATVELQNVVITEDEIFDIFEYPILRGNRGEMLQNPNSIVLTETAAHTLFGDEDPIGQTLITSSNAEFQVTGIMADGPALSHQEFNAFLSMNRWNHVRTPTSSWTNQFLMTYLLLEEGSDIATVEETINETAEQWAEDLNPFMLQPLSDIHFNPQTIQFDYAWNVSDITYVYGLISLGLFILLLALVNYTNLATSRAILRAREVGIRKVAGANRKQLVLQFLLEVFGELILAFILAIGIAYLFDPIGSEWAGRPINLQALFSGNFILIIPICVMILSVLSGLYPALLLSGYQPARVLKGVVAHGQSGVRIRRLLSLFQFAVTITLLVGITVLNGQMRFIRNLDLGYERSRVLSLSTYGSEFEGRRQTLIQELNVLPAVEHVAGISTPPFNGWSMTDMHPEGMADGQEIDTYRYHMDPATRDVFNFPVIEGRFFNAEQDNMPADASNPGLMPCVVTRGFAENAGWSSSVGKSLDDNDRHMIVVGVIEDFYFRSLHEVKEPAVIIPCAPTDRHHIVMVLNGDISEALTSVQSVWQTVIPDVPFSYRFMDEYYMEDYNKEANIVTILEAGTGLAIVVAFLGLFGLASFATERRLKEIGIRKVLGARVDQLLGLLTREYLLLIIFSTVFSVVPGWLLGRYFLQDFAYKIVFPWWSYLLAGGAALLLALITSGLIAFRAAQSNPVNVLKYE